MLCFFRSLSTWEHIAKLDVADYAFPIYSVGKKTGAIKVAGEDQNLSGCWAIMDGRVFYAQKAAPSNGYTTVTISKPIYAFSRDLVYSGDGTEDLEDFIAGEIEDNYIDQSDTPFATPYITVTTFGTTAADLAYSNNEVYAFTEVLELAEEMGIEFTFTPSSDGLALHIAPRSNDAYNLFFGDGHSQLLSVSVSSDIVSKVTCRRIAVEDDVITVSTTKDFFWHEDGSISDTAPNPRIPGKWSIVSVTDEDIDLDVAASEAMSGNNSTLKITFASDKVFKLGDTITCRANGKTITAKITLATLSKSDPRITYELGDMPTTLTEKYEAAAATKREQSVTYEGTAETPISASGGTVGGSLSVNENLKTSVLIIGPESYGTSLPATGKVGQLFFLLS